MKDKIDLALKKLYDDKKATDYKIQALKLAKKLLVEERGVGRGDLVADTAAFVRGRKNPTSVSTVAKHFKITVGAANQRLLEAKKKGLIKRVKRGYYHSG